MGGIYKTRAVIVDIITSGEKQEMEDSTREIVKKAAQIVGSLKDTEFDIRSGLFRV
jgi:hypothetical protein